MFVSFPISSFQILSKEDREVLYNCKVMHKRGECPPLIVVFDSREGCGLVSFNTLHSLTFDTLN